MNLSFQERELLRKYHRLTDQKVLDEAVTSLVLSLPPKIWNRDSRHRNPTTFQYAFNDLRVFVEMAMDEKETPIRLEMNRLGREHYSQTLLAKRFFRFLPTFVTLIEFLPTNFKYIERFEVLKQCWQDIEETHKFAIELDAWYRPSISPLYPETDLAVAAFNRITELLRIACKKQGIRKKFKARVSKTKERHGKWVSQVKKLFQLYPRLIVIRIDLGYQQDAPSEATSKYLSDLDRFINNQRHNNIFDHCVDYIIKTEFGLDKGLHHHCVFFFDGNKCKKGTDVFRAKKIGVYWRDKITKGFCVYWNCNGKAKEYEAKGILGIGYIHRDDLLLMENLTERVLGYLAKAEQFIRGDLPDVFRKVRRGLGSKGKASSSNSKKGK